MQIAIVTDSTCDIPYDIARQYQIHIVPNILVIDGESIADDEQFSRHDFYVRQPGMKTFPTTATASSGTYHSLYEKLFQLGADHIISIHASHLLSGIFNAASVAAQAFTGRIHVIDSETVTLGLGFQALAAAEDVAAGFSLEAVLAHLEHIRPRARVVALLDTLEYVRRSGRVSWVRAGIGSLLNIKLLVEVKDGLVQRLGEVRTRGKGIARLLAILHDLGPLERLAILHTNAESEARQILESFAPQLPTVPLLVNITTVIGAHVGPNGLGFAALTA